MSTYQQTISGNQFATLYLHQVKLKRFTCFFAGWFYNSLVLSGECRSASAALLIPVQ